jgi:hypothetical protein
MSTPNLDPELQEVDLIDPQKSAELLIRLKGIYDDVKKRAEHEDEFSKIFSRRVVELRSQLKEMENLIINGYQKCCENYNEQFMDYLDSRLDDSIKQLINNPSSRSKIFFLKEVARIWKVDNRKVLQYFRQESHSFASGLLNIARRSNRTKAWNLLCHNMHARAKKWKKGDKSKWGFTIYDIIAVRRHLDEESKLEKEKEHELQQQKNNQREIQHHQPHELQQQLLPQLLQLDDAILQQEEQTKVQNDQTEESEVANDLHYIESSGNTLFDL